MDVQDVLSQLLPSFRFRITDDPKIMQLAVDRVKQALTGGTYDKTSNPSNATNKLLTVPSEASASAKTSTVGIPENSQPSDEKQSITEAGLLKEASPNDSKKE